MSKPNRKRMRLSEMRAQQTAAAKVTHLDLDFETADGKEHTCSFLAQDLWPIELIEEVQAKGGDANIAILREIASPAEEFDVLVREMKLTVGELKEIIGELDGEAGTTAGEGSGS